MDRLLQKMDKEEIMAVYLLFLRYGPSSLIKCIHAICVAEAIEDNHESFLEYFNELHKHQEVVYHMLHVATGTGKNHENVTAAYTVIEPGGTKKKMKIEDLGDVGTSKGVVTTGW